MTSLTTADPTRPALILTGPRSIAIRAGTNFAGDVFESDTSVELPQGELVAGTDYGVAVTDGIPRAWRALAVPSGAGAIGGFHFAPGGNAVAFGGGDKIPAINPCSLWDLNFRPACPDPRGMVLVERDGLKFWADIYLLGVNHHADGTSCFGVVIADGRSTPFDPKTRRGFPKLDYETARAVMAHYGKGLMSQDEFRAFADGVTEYSACGTDPKITGLDAKRTSAVGGMQATGNMWVWGHDGLLQPRASIFGGSWFNGSSAGSRFACVVYWPENSTANLGARGRSDHLQLD
jgi:hypothetical protein